MLLLLDPYVDAILALALAFILAQIIRAAVSPLGGIPGIGSAITGAANSIATAISGVLARVVSGIDKAVGASISWVATQVDTLAQAVKRPAIAIAESATLLGAVVAGFHALKSLVHSVEHAGSRAVAGVKTLEKEFNGIEHRVKTLEREIGRGIGHDLRLHIKALESEWHSFKTKELPTIEADIGAAGSDVATAERWVAKNFVSNAALVTEATVAALLTVGGLGWLRCNSNPFNGNKNACGLWSVLGRVLGLAAFLTVAFDFREFVSASDEVAQFIGTAVGEFEGAFPLSLPPLPPPQ